MNFVKTSAVLVATCLLALSTTSSAQDLKPNAVPPPESAAPWLRLPDVDPAVAQPVVKAVNVLKSNELYVFDSDKKVIVIASPAGLVRIEEEAQKPGDTLKVKALFAGNTRMSTRTFKGQQVFLVEAVASGTVELIITPVELKRESDIIRRVIRVEAGEGPQPPPDVKPDPVKLPIAGEGFRVLITYPDPAKVKVNLTMEQHSAIYGQEIRDYLNRKCVVGPDGKTKEWRIYKEGENLSLETATWRDAYARTRTASPWVMVSNGKTGDEGPIAANGTVNGIPLMTLLKKHGGE